MNPTIDLTLTVLIAPRKRWWQLWLPVELEFDVEATFSYEIDNSGIGNYEYHGQKCYDKGEDYLGNVWYESHSFNRSDLPWYYRKSKGVDKLIAIALETMADETGGYVQDKIWDSLSV